MTNTRRAPSCSWFLDGDPRGTPWSKPTSGMRESEQPMTDPHEAAAAQGVKAAEELRRVLALWAPNATNVQIKTVNHNPRQIEIIEYQPDLPDGSTVYAPHIIIRRG